MMVKGSYRTNEENELWGTLGIAEPQDPFTIQRSNTMKAMSVILSLVVAVLFIGPAYAADGSHQAKHTKHTAASPTPSGTVAQAGKTDRSEETTSGVTKSTVAQGTAMAHKEGTGNVSGKTKVSRHIRHHHKKADAK
jgi:hypothetical protein